MGSGISLHGDEGDMNYMMCPNAVKNLKDCGAVHTQNVEERASDDGLAIMMKNHEPPSLQTTPGTMLLAIKQLRDAAIWRQFVTDFLQLNMKLHWSLVLSSIMESKRQRNGRGTAAKRSEAIKGEGNLGVAEKSMDPSSLYGKAILQSKSGLGGASTCLF
ncbi:hypothetical protein ACS0TY_028482 [Phlomoides rotata]